MLNPMQSPTDDPGVSPVELGNPNPAIPGDAGTPSTSANPSGQEKWFGKYNSAEEAEKGYWNLVDTLKDREARLNYMEEQVNLLMQRGQSAPSQPNDPFEQLDNVGIPRDAFLGAVSKEVQRQMQPLLSGLQAQATFESSHPEYQQVKADVAKFLGQSPQLTSDFNSLYATNPLRAMEWAYDRYREAKPATPRTSAADNPRAAALPQVGSKDATQSEDAFDIRKAEQAAEIYRQRGDINPLIREYSKKIRPWGM